VEFSIWQISMGFPKCGTSRLPDAISTYINGFPTAIADVDMLLIQNCIIVLVTSDNWSACILLCAVTQIFVWLVANKSIPRSLCSSQMLLMLSNLSSSSHPNT